MSSSLTLVQNSVEKAYGPHNQGFMVMGTSLLFITESQAAKARVFHWQSKPYLCTRATSNRYPQVFLAFVGISLLPGGDFSSLCPVFRKDSGLSI
jgi:hypothetical protein